MLNPDIHYPGQDINAKTVTTHPLHQYGRLHKIGVNIVFLATKHESDICSIWLLLTELARVHDNYLATDRLDIRADVLLKFFDLRNDCH